MTLIYQTLNQFIKLIAFLLSNVLFEKSLC